MASDSFCAVAWLQPPERPAAVTWKTVGTVNATAASVSVVAEAQAVFVEALLPKFHAAADNRNSHDEQDIAKTLAQLAAGFCSCGRRATRLATAGERDRL